MTEFVLSEWVNSQSQRFLMGVYINFIATRENSAFLRLEMCISFHLQISLIEIYTSDILACLRTDLYKRFFITVKFLNTKDWKLFKFH